MRILSAIVDKRPCQCVSCPIDSRIKTRAPCGEVKTISGNGNVQKVKVPDHRCLLHVIKR